MTKIFGNNGNSKQAKTSVVRTHSNPQLINSTPNHFGSPSKKEQIQPYSDDKGIQSAAGQVAERAFAELQDAKSTFLIE